MTSYTVERGYEIIKKEYGEGIADIWKAKFPGDDSRVLSFGEAYGTLDSVLDEQCPKRIPRFARTNSRDCEVRLIFPSKR